VQDLNSPGQLMYGSPVSKDLNLPVQPPMASSGLLRYRSAPSSVLGELCEDFLPAGARAASPDAGADGVFARFLADHHIRDDKPAPAPAPAAGHFASEADMASQQQQQMMFHSQHQHQEMVDAKSGLYRTVSSGMETASAAGAGVGSSNLARQSSSPAGFLDHLNMENGWSLLSSAFFWYFCSCHSLLASRVAIIAVLGEFFFLEPFLFLELSVSHLRCFAQLRVRCHAEGGHEHGLQGRQQRRHGRLSCRWWQQAKGAAQLLVTAGIVDVTDLRDGQ